MSETRQRTPEYTTEQRIRMECLHLAGSTGSQDREPADIVKRPNCSPTSCKASPTCRPAWRSASVRPVRSSWLNVESASDLINDESPPPQP